MFYSKDLLSRRSPLGAIWMVAHGKKLSKNKLMGISVQEICEEIMHPSVPHSLRLQGILVGGVVVVFSKQQVYLLEDVQEMMRRVKDAINLHNAGPSKATLKKGKDRARLETITLVDDAEAGADLQQVLDLNNALARLTGGAQQLNVLPLTQHMPGCTPADLTQMQEDDLFAVPAISTRTGSTYSQAAMFDSAAPPQAGITRAGHRPHHHHTGSVAGSDPDNELFGLVVDLGDELGFPGPAFTGGHAGSAARGGTAGAAGQEQEQQELLDEHMNDHLMVEAEGSRARSGQPAGTSSIRAGSRSHPGHSAGGSPAGRLGGPGAGLLDEEEEDVWGHREVMSPNEEQALSDHRAAVAAGLRADFAAQDQEVLTTEGDEEEQQVAAAGGRGKQARAGADGKRGSAGQKRQRPGVTRRQTALMIDDADDIVIKSKEFREWTLNTASLLVTRGLLPRPARANTLLTPANLLAPGILMLTSDGPCKGLRLCDDLKALLMRAHHLGRAASSAAQQQDEDEIEEDDDDREQDLNKGKRRVKRARATPAGAPTETSTDAAGAGLGAGDASAYEPLIEEEEEAGLHHEMQDVLHELPFGGDVEVERLRAASTTPGAAAGGRLSLGSDGVRLLGTGTSAQHTSSLATSNNTSRQGSILAGGLISRGERSSLDGGHTSDLLLPSGGRPGSSTAGSAGRGGAGGGGGALLHWGTGALDDLLPSLDQDMPDLLMDLRAGTASESDQLGGVGAGGSDLLASRGTQDVSGSAAGGGGGGGGVLPGTDNYLLETCGEGSAPQVQLDSDVLSGNTGKVVKLMRGLLAAQQAGGATDPAVSFFDLAQRLTRREAVKLFMQVLVTQTASYTVASQEEAYGDILIRAGRLMP